MARRSKPGDLVYNARRRYTRQAERYMKKANQASGIEKARYEGLARTSVEKAIATYDNPQTANMSGSLKQLSSQLSPRMPVKRVSDSYKSRLVQESKTNALESSMMDEDTRRDVEAQVILSSQAGGRVYAALVSVWKDSGEDANSAIMEWFGADDMMEVLEQIEAAGIDIYADPESQTKYDEIVTAIQKAFISL